MACIIDSCVPTHSSTESAPMPFVSSLTRATPSSPRSVTNVRRTKFSSELLARRVTAHGDDSLCAHLFRGEHAEQTDRTVTDYRDSRARRHVGCIGGKPTSAHDIGECQQVWNQIRRRYVRCGHQSAVREWDTQQRRLCSAYQLAVLAGRLVSDPTGRSEEHTSELQSR